MARHVSTYYLAVPSVMVFTLERTSPGLYRPWTVTRVAWSAVLMPNVSGITTDVVLFSEHGARLVHHYRVYGDCVSLSSLRGTFMANWSEFTNRACSEALSVAKGGRDSSTESGSSGTFARRACLPHVRPRPSGFGKLSGLWLLLHHLLTPTFPLCRYLHCPARSLLARSSTQDESSSVGTSAEASVAEYSAPPAPISVRPAATDPNGVTATPAFCHTGFCSDTGYRTAALGRNPVVPIVAVVPVVDPWL